MDGTHVADLVTANAARVPEQPAVIDVTSGDTLTWAQLDEAVSAEADRVSGGGCRARRPRGRAAGQRRGVLRRGARRAPRGRGRGAARPGRRRARSSTSCSPTAARRSSSRPRATTPPGPARPPSAPPWCRPRTSPRARPAGPGVGAGEDIALLVYASGTTGVPRGIRLSHRALLANRAQTAALRPAPVTPVDRVLLSLPLFHSFGLAAGLPAGVLGGRHGGARRAARAPSRSPTSWSRSG